jgi:hypothetical protein
MEGPVSAAVEKCVTLAAERAVDPAAVEDNLAELWRSAGRRAQRETGGNVTRACLWNLVVYNPRKKAGYKDLSGHGYGLRTLLDELVLSLPARVIRLEFVKHPRILPPGKGAAAWVAAKCLDRPDGRRQIYGEEVNLKVRERSGDSHFPSLVRALLQPNLPIALLGVDDLPGEGWMREQLLRLCDRIVVDTQSVAHACDPQLAHRFMEATDAYVVDISWMRLTPVRYFLAGFFDPQAQTGKLKQIERITVEATPKGRHAGTMLLGWFLGRCGHRRFAPAPGKRSGNHLRWTVGTGKKTFPAEVKVKKGEGGADGLLRIEVRAGGSLFSIRQVDAHHVALEAPGRNDAKVALNGWTDAELVIAALGSQGVDPVFVETLRDTVKLLATGG